MTPPKYRFYLLKAPGEYYYIDGAGDIDTVVSPGNLLYYSLKDDPANWGEIEIRWTRNRTYMGLFRTISSAIEFVGDGAKICRHSLYNDGYESTLLFELHVRDDISWDYSLLFSGNVHFPTVVDDQYSLTVEVAEGGIYGLLKANENTEYDIPIVRSEATQVSILGKEQQADYVYVSLNTSLAPYMSTSLLGMPAAAASKDGAYSVGEQKSATAINMGTPLPGGPIWSVNSAEHNNFLYKADQVVKFRLKVRHSIEYTNPSSNTLNFHLETRLLICTSTSGTPYQTYVVYSDASTPLVPGAPARTAFINTTSPTFTINKDDRVYYVVYIQGPGAGGTATSNVAIHGAQNIDLLIDFTLPPTPTEGLRYYEGFQKLVEQMTDGQYEGVSLYLSDPSTNTVDSIPYQLLMTSGDALRNVYISPTGQPRTPSLRMSLTRLFQDALGRWLMGLGVNSNGDLILEHLSTFFNDSTLIADIGEVTDLHIQVAQDYLFTDFKTGFPDQTYDRLNGRDEPNTTSLWKMPITSIPSKSEDFTSPWRGDMYGIEYTRANLGNQNTTDNEGDKNVFLLDIDTSQETIGTSYRDPSIHTGYRLRRPNTTSNTTGVLSAGTAFNLSLSPARSLRRLGPLLHSVAYQLDAKSITFQTANKNDEMVSNLGAGSIAEKSDVPINQLAAILFKPVLFRFRLEAPFDLAGTMANPYGYFLAKHNGRIIRGFPMAVSIRPGRSTAQEWTLLATPTCDLTQFA